MLFLWNGPCLFNLDIFHAPTTEICDFVFQIWRVIYHDQRINKTCQIWQKKYVYMLSTKYGLILSNKPSIFHHLDMKLTICVTIHTLKMGTLCQYYSIINVLLRIFSCYKLWNGTSIHFPLKCYHNHTWIPKTDKLAAFLSCVPPEYHLFVAWFKTIFSPLTNNHNCQMDRYY